MKAADKTWAALIAAGLAADAWLAYKRRPLLTHRARTPAGTAMQALLVAHFAGVLPRWADPFHAIVTIARRVRDRGGLPSDWQAAL